MCLCVCVCVRIFVLSFPFIVCVCVVFPFFFTVGPTSRVPGLWSGCRTCRLRVSRAEAYRLCLGFTLVINFPKILIVSENRK